MRPQKSQLKGLYAITDENLIPDNLFKETVEAALQGGIKVIQYRDKSTDQDKRLQQASALIQLCKQYDTLCIINDDIELTKAVNADGVHLGRDDSSIVRAREVLGLNSIIGVSCYNDITLAIGAEKNGANYVAFGAIFPSLTKPEAANASLALITQAKQQLSIPVCAIGGISEANIQKVVQHGADMAAIISTLFSANDIKKTAHTLSQHYS